MTTGRSQPSAQPKRAAPLAEAPVCGEGFGKIILLGEHAVVYGEPALAAGVPLIARATITEEAGSQGGHLHWRGPAPSWSAEAANIAEQALGALVESLGYGEDLCFVLETDIPLGAGLGSSAALGVAIARAITHREQMKGTDLSDLQVFEAAAAWDRIFHGNASGIDTAVSMSCGVTLFRKPDHRFQVRLGCPLPLVVAFAHTTSPTASMVARVRQEYDAKPEATKRMLEAIGILVTNAQHALMAGDLKGLGKFLDLNQALLSSLYVSTEELEGMCALARQSGALGAKLTGGGGGGAMLALSASDPEAKKLADEFVRSGFKAFALTISETNSEVRV